MIKPIVQDLILKGWGVDPDTYFGEYPKRVAIEIDPFHDPHWLKDKSLFKVAVQVEPPSVNNQAVEEYLSMEGNKFDLILTYYDSILSNLPNAKLNYFAGTWITDIKENFDKNKLVSFITSNKNFATGHKVRMEVVETLRDKFDLYGRGFNEISNKIIGLENYRYSVVIENEFMENWFTEKIIDCFMTKTIPIYMGCPNIGDFYDDAGIIKFNTKDELSNILDSLDSIDYSSFAESVEKNYNKAIMDLPFNKRVEILIKEML
jgi:hypothetical protein